jgi:putative FmdB family regulatory protein
VPVFEYKCQKCGAEFDDLDSVDNRDKPHKCPACGSMKSERQMSVFCANSGDSGGGDSGGGGKICPSTGGT